VNIAPLSYPLAPAFVPRSALRAATGLLVPGRIICRTNLLGWSSLSPHYPPPNALTRPDVFPWWRVFSEMRTRGGPAVPLYFWYHVHPSIAPCLIVGIQKSLTRFPDRFESGLAACGPLVVVFCSPVPSIGKCGGALT